VPLITLLRQGVVVDIIAAAHEERACKMEAEGIRGLAPSH